MKNITINTTISGYPVVIKNVTKKTDFGKLKETLRDNLTPVIGDQDWKKIIEIIRDTVLPQLQ